MQTPDTHLTGLERATARELTIPLIGEIVDLDNPNQVALAIDAVREAKRILDDIRAHLERELVDEARRQGTKTLHLAGLDAVITGGTRTEYDAHKLQLLLRHHGLPEPRIAEAVVEIVSYKPNAAVLKQLASANDDYADAIQASKSVVDVPYRVSIRR